MPSDSNYDNPCESGQMNFSGMRNDYELRDYEPETNHGIHSFHAEQFGALESNNTGNFVPNFHGSSNGYYGYHMITSTNTSNIDASKDEYFMDTNDDFANQGVVTHLNSGRLIEDARRKRPLATSSETLPKRLRQEPTTDDFRLEGPPPPHHEIRNLSSYEEVRSAVLRRPIKSKSDGITWSRRETCLGSRAGEVLNMKREISVGNQKNLEFIEILLKETHGCDLYNYRACDL